MTEQPADQDASPDGCTVRRRKKLAIFLATKNNRTITVVAATSGSTTARMERKVALKPSMMATIGLLASAAFGYGLHGPVGPPMQRHVLVALASCLLLLFSHCWIMFYLIGTGKAIKDAVKEFGLEQHLIEETKRFKNVSYPWLMLTICTVLYLLSLPAGWKSYRDHARNAAAQAAPVGDVAVQGSASPSYVSAPPETDANERPARLN